MQTHQLGKNNYISPLGECFGILVPRYLYTNWIAGHAIKVRISRGRTVEELPPQQLAVQREWRIGLFHFLIQVRQLVIEQTRAEASEPEVRRQTGLARQ